MPVYYRSFPGNVPDSRSLSVILEDLRQANFKDVVLVTDRGYESIRNLETYIDLNQPLIMGTKLGQKHVREILSQLGSFDHHPQEMQVDAKNRLYYLQKDLSYQIEGQRGNLKQADRLKLNLYFDPMRRGQELIDLDITRDTQKAALEEYLENKIPLDDDETLKQVYRFYDLTYDHSTRILKAFTLNQKKVEKYRQEAGFFANTTHGLDLSPIEVHEHYKLREEQEKYFALMKGICGQDRPRTSTASGRIGRSFILFVAQIMGCYLSHIRRTKLGTDFASTADVLGEMRPIRYLEHPHTKPMLTPFVGKQLEVCEAFAIGFPEGCAPSYPVRQTSRGKRGRPSKNPVILNAELSS